MRVGAGMLAMAAAAMLLGGCCSAEYALDPAPEGTTVAEGYRAVAVGTATNSGYYLFNLWPIVSGHSGRPNAHDYRFFRNNITPARNAEMLQEGMNKVYRAEKLEQVESRVQCWGYFSLWLVWRRTISTTAIGVRQNRIKKAPDAAQ
ncbi:hypothetical protein SDC9_199061 [bioreactor metagenome]|uniref:Lipoprotein n=1 Tax=bioreactor metagenome TaxID=1076179 RepID=A0A645IK76_9ZZZZ